MKLSFTKLKPNSPDFRSIKQLYMRAFPDEERAPFLMLVLKAKKKGVDFWSISCDGKWAGLLYIVNHRDLSYIFYLAVSEECRGRGIGSACLTKTPIITSSGSAERTFISAAASASSTGSSAKAM